MGSTHITSTTDTILSVSSPLDPNLQSTRARNGPSEFELLPISKRTQLSITKQFGVQLDEDPAKNWAKLVIVEDVTREISRGALTVIPLFFRDGLRLSANSLAKATDGILSSNEIRDVIWELVEEKCLRRKPGVGAGRYVLELHPDLEAYKRNPNMVVLSQYQEDAIKRCEV